MFKRYLENNMKKIMTLLKIIRAKILFSNKNIKVRSKSRIDFTTKLFVDKDSTIFIDSLFQTRRFCELRSFDGGNIKIGSNVFLNNNVNIVCHEKIIIGNNVQIGHNSLIIDHDHDFKNNMNNFISKEIFIGNNVWIGANCTILKGVKIGNNCVIAAGSLVNKNVDDNSIFYNKRVEKIIMRS